MKKNILILSLILFILNPIEVFTKENNTVIYNKLLKSKYLTFFYLSFSESVKPSKILLLETNQTENEKNIKFRIEGIDDNKTLWVNGSFKIKEDIITDLKWGDRNTLLVATKKSYIINRLLKNLTYEYQWIKEEYTWTKNTSNIIKEKIIRQRLYNAINNSFFLDNDLNRKKNWLDTIPELPIKLVNKLILSIKRENIRYLLKKRNLIIELNKSRIKRKNKKFDNYDFLRRKENGFTFPSSPSPFPPSWSDIYENRGIKFKKIF